MATLYTHKDRNILKTWLFMVMFFAVVIGVGWAVSWYYRNTAILYVAVAFSVFMNVLSYWYSDTIVLRMAGARPVDRESYRELWNIIENLSITAGLPMPRVYIINDPSPNAFATGRNHEHAVIAFTTGILHILNRQELEGVAAHELSHIGNRDMLLSTVIVVLVGFVTIVSDMFLRMTFWGNSGRRSEGGRGGNQFTIIIAIVLIVLAPIAATLMRLAISRKRELLADASGALLTRYPEGLASALEKISSVGIPLRKASNATAHLYISDPFTKEQRAGFFEKLFMTHPPVIERVAALRSGDY